MASKRGPNRKRLEMVASILEEISHRPKVPVRETKVNGEIKTVLVWQELIKTTLKNTIYKFIETEGVEIY